MLFQCILPPILFAILVVGAPLGVPDIGETTIGDLKTTTLSSLTFSIPTISNPIPTSRISSVDIPTPTLTISIPTGPAPTLCTTTLSGSGTLPSPISVSTPIGTFLTSSNENDRCSISISRPSLSILPTSITNSVGSGTPTGHVPTTTANTYENDNDHISRPSLAVPPTTLTEGVGSGTPTPHTV